MFESLICALQTRYSGLRHVLRQRCTRAGQLLLAGLALSAVLGLDTNRNLGYQVFALLLCLLLAALPGLRGFKPQVRVRRSLPRIGTVGDALSYRVWISNAGTETLSGIECAEQLPDPRPSAATFRAARRQGEALHARWQRLCAQALWAQPRTVPLPDLQPGVEAELALELLPVRRGRLHLSHLQLAQPELLGLLKRRHDVACADSVLILPRRFRLPPLDLPGNRAVLQGAQALSSSVADAEEFQSLRDYRPGDPLRLIHWKSWARSGKPVIREFQDEFAVRHALVLDTFMTGAHEAIFEDAVSLAASFACQMETQESLLDLLFVGAEVYRETSGRGHGPVERLLEVLAGVQPCTQHPFQILSNAVVGQRSALSACICVLLAWDETRKAFVERLGALGLPHTVFILTDAARSNLPALTNGALPAGVHLLEVGRVEEGLVAR